MTALDDAREALKLPPWQHQAVIARSEMLVGLVRYCERLEGELRELRETDPVTGAGRCARCGERCDYC